MKAQELLDKAVNLKYGDEIPLFKGVYIIQHRKLHDSGYRLMSIIGHTEYDKELDQLYFGFKVVVETTKELESDNDD